MRNLTRVPLAAAGVLAAIAAWPASAQKSYEIKIGFVTINDSNHRSSELLKAALEKRTAGKLKVKIFPAAQLGIIPRQLEGIQLGTQAFFFTPPGFFQGINPAFQAPDAPGMFDSHWHQHLTLNHPSVRPEWDKLGMEAGIVPVYLWSAGVGAISSRDPIRTLADLEGKKLRVLATKMEIALMEVFGAAGVPIPYSQVVPSIQRRVVDGARSAIIVMGPSKFYTVAKYLTRTAGGYIPVGAYASLAVLKKLPKDLQTAIWEEGAKLTDTTVEIAIEITTHWEKQWVKEGGEVIDFSAADREEFFRRAKPLGDKILGSNPKIAPMYNLIKAAAEQTRAEAAVKHKATMMRLEKEMK
ncbi:MAG: TRAP transporter substrate-binding protein [Defluviicoccus sp.]|nr:TRAP transporter substrate-binding protein [Defluviicoccus sp.]